MKKRYKNIQEWSWIIIVTFFILSIVDIRFGLFGFVCMGVPIAGALMGHGKVHCSHHCPRGSFLGKLRPVSFGKPLPKWARKHLKKITLVLMFTMFAIGLSHTFPDPKAMGFVLFRLMFASFIVGVIMGVIFKPRAWCQVCPMGYAGELITKAKRKNQTPKKNVEKA